MFLGGFLQVLPSIFFFRLWFLLPSWHITGWDIFISYGLDSSSQSHELWGRCRAQLTFCSGISSLCSPDPKGTSPWNSQPHRRQGVITDPLLILLPELSSCASCAQEISPARCIPSPSAAPLPPNTKLTSAGIKNKAWEKKKTKNKPPSADPFAEDKNASRFASIIFFPDQTSYILFQLAEGGLTFSWFLK